MKSWSKRAACAVLAAILALAGSFAGCSDRGGQDTPPEQEKPSDDYPEEIFTSEIHNTSKVGYYAEYLGTAERRSPQVSDGGLESYPMYGETFSASEQLKQAVFDENTALNASASTYDSMDAEGNLYLAGEPTGGKLYKHTAAAGMYEGDVSDDEPALVKRISVQSRGGGNYLTGLYAPAGEVVKIEMSEKDLRATGGLKIEIGQALTNGQANNIWLARDFNRMPVILNTMTASKTLSYVGSFLGGPIYVRPVNAGADFTVTVSGGVAYSHFILGYTAREEFERNASSTAPYFDLEVWDDGVRHSGPKSRAEQFDYADLTDAAVLWDKIALVSNKVPAGSSGNIGITFLYDPFVAAGSMVAFVGRHTVNCPLYCMTAALDAESAVNNSSDAFWGCIHEFNHHFQRFGFAPGDEVTNNAVSLVEYSLFTKNSANRALGNADEGSYATGWNRYTNPGWVLKQTLSRSGVNSGLDTYANLLHAFGQDAFIRAAQGGNGQGGADAWFRAVCDATGYDMTYYFTELLGQTVSQSVLSEYAGKNLPMFVPVASIYQTGRSYLYEGETRYSRTAEPYGIEAEKPFTLDLNANVVAPDGFRVTVKEVTQPAAGALARKSEGVYVYTPDPSSRDSGEIFVTLGIEKEDGAFEAEDVTLVIQLRQKQYKPDVLERTVYVYSPENMYASVEEAVANGFAGYDLMRTEDNENRVQDGNAEIWEPNPSSNAVMVISGKFYIPSAGKYRVALRGRRYAGLYLSADGQNYERAALVDNAAGTPSFDLSDPGHYSDLTFEKGQWVYFRAVLLVTQSNAFIGVGLGRFSGENVSVGHLNAYRNSYVREEFTADYFYTRGYTYDYSDGGGARPSLVSAQYRPWDENYPIDALFDEDDTNFIHSDRTNISEENPFAMTVDLGTAIRANTFTVYGEPSRQYQPKNFVLYGGDSPDSLEKIAEYTDAPRTGSNVVVTFPERELRCYKLVVTDTYAGGPKYIAFRRAEMTHTIAGGALYSPDEVRFVWRGNWEIMQAPATFGHLYAGENAVLSFTFTGTRFALLSYGSEGYGAFEVIIDGKAAGSGAAASGGEGTVSYLSGLLSAGEHAVLVRSRQKFNIESIALWQ